MPAASALHVELSLLLADLLTSKNVLLSCCEDINQNLRYAAIWGAERRCW